MYTDGDRRDTHDFEGYFAKFIDRMKADNHDKSLVMNAVSTFGGSKIVGTNNVEFGYNEMWGGDDYLWNYRKIIQDNRRNNGKNTFNNSLCSLSYTVAMAMAVSSIRAVRCLAMLLSSHSVVLVLS